MYVACVRRTRVYRQVATWFIVVVDSLSRGGGGRITAAARRN